MRVQQQAHGRSPRNAAASSSGSCSEVFEQMNPTCPLAWTSWGSCARWNYAGHHVAGAGYLDLVDLAGLNGGHKL